LPRGRRTTAHPVVGPALERGTTAPRRRSHVDGVPRRGDRDRRPRLQPPWRRSATDTRSATGDPAVTLEVRNLTVSIGPYEIVSIEELDIPTGRRLGVVGESGSGKTITAM